MFEIAQSIKHFSVFTVLYCFGTKRLILPRRYPFSTQVVPRILGVGSLLFLPLEIGQPGGLALEIVGLNDLDPVGLPGVCFRFIA